MEISFKEFLSYKHTNKDILPDLVDFIKVISTDPRYKKSKWSKAKEPNNWLTSKKFTQDETEKIQSDIKSLLNKMTCANFDTLSEQIIDLNIDKEDHLVILTKTLFDKAKIEKNFANIYAKLSKKMAQYYVETDGERIFFKDLLIKRCQEVFEVSISLKSELGTPGSDCDEFNFKEEVVSFITFIGELYKNNILTDTIVNTCFSRIFMKIMLKKPYIIDILCTLMNTVYEQLKINCPTNFGECVDMMENIMQYPTITNKEKYMIMDTLDMIKKD